MMKIAVIGAGPSGFFAAGEVFKRIPEAEVHMIEKRPSPYGLVRFGVAPDHTITRRVTRMFDQIAGHTGFFYYGGVEIGRDISFEEVRASFHAVMVCTGAEQPKRPNLPGSTLRGAVDALDFSWWVNGGGGSFSSELLDGVEKAVVVGNGNVALDAARMLMRSPADWEETDIALDAKNALAAHRIREVTILGRRGAENASFTEAELEEVLTLPNCRITSNSVMPFGLPVSENDAERGITFLFNRRPVSILGSKRVEGLEIMNTETGSAAQMDAQLVIFATGHRAVPIGNLPIDEASGTVRNEQGRVTGFPGVYVCGWIKRGARGLIGHNRKDAIETVSAMLEDLPQFRVLPGVARTWEQLLSEKRVFPVSWPEWLASNQLG